MTRFGALVVLVGCAATTDDDSALEITAASDVEELARVADEAAAAFDPSAVTMSIEGDVDGVGDCVWSWSVTGPPTGATFSAAVDVVPCGGSVSGARGSVDYAVQLGQLDGTVVKNGDGWDYDLTGERTAEITVVTDRRGERTYTGDWTLDALTGTFTGDGTGPFDAALSYVGWLGGDWDLAVSRGADGVYAGTLTGPRGSTCVISGSAGSVDIDCDSTAVE